MWNGKLAILMATYNGIPYVTEQIESIRRQSYSEWVLFIRDDGSSDGTQSLLREIAQQDNRIILLSDGRDRLGILNNFSTLMQHAIDVGADYVIFSDQDDVWDDEKVYRQMSVIEMFESKYGKMPILVHSDMQVVDDELAQIAASFMNYQGIYHEGSKALHVLLAQNFVTGCTVIANRSLLEISMPISNAALMHDWWLALCAAAFGKIEYIEEPLVKYRQHGENEVGAKSIKSYLNPFQTNWWRHWLKGRRNLLQSMYQAKVLAERVREFDPRNRSLKCIEAYALLPTLSPLQRIKMLKGSNVHCQSWFRHVLFLSRLLTIPRQVNE